jgi:transcriptional regulator with XRE-family HTH domain
MLATAAVEVIVIGVELTAMHAREHESRTPGGSSLRTLREAAGKTQLWVEAEAEIGTGYLQRLESGKILQPERTTLVRILAALGARYSERRDVLERFGYLAPTTPPSEADSAWARALCQHELHDVTFPAYVLDCMHRLIAWNRSVPHLFGVHPDDATLGRLSGSSLLAAWFNPAAPLAPLVAEPDVFLPALIRAMRYEMQRFHTEPWWTTVMAGLLALPRFRHYWEIVEGETAPASAARALVPVRLNVPGAGSLLFRLSSEQFTRDARFRLVYYFPADAATMQQCAIWETQIRSSRQD